MIRPKQTTSIFWSVVAVSIISIAFVTTAAAANHGDMRMTKPMPGAREMLIGPGLMMPEMNPARGRKLFASKGCVVCHSVNEVGGQDARALDAATMDLPMGPFEFSARMWRGAEPMIALQRKELGTQIEFTGQELADMIAFIHDAEEQKKFSVSDIPHQIKDMMSKAHSPREKH